MSLQTRSSRRDASKFATSVYWLFWAAGAWKRQRQERLSLNFLSLLQDRVFKNTSFAKDPLPGSFINLGRLTLITGEKTRQTLSQASRPPIYFSKATLISPKIICSPLRDPHSLSSFLIKMVLKFEFLATSGSYSSFFGCLPCIHEAYMLINLFFSC